MSIEAQTAADARTVITWREAVERAQSVARVFEDGRPVFGVDSLGHVVLANRAAAAFSGGAVAFGKAVPPGGTVAALVAGCAPRPTTGETTFERTRAVMGLRATMLGLKLSKAEVAPFGSLTLITFAEGVAPIPDEGGVMGDPLDPGLQIDPPQGAEAVDVSTEVAGTRPALDTDADLTAPAALAAVAAAITAPAVVTMEDPFSDASFAAFSPISIDAEEWGVSAPAVAAAPTDAAVEGLDEPKAIEPELPMPAVADAPWLDEMSADDAEPVDELLPPEPVGALDMVARDEAIAAAPVAADAIAAGLVERVTPADHGLDGVAALAALDGAAEPEALAEALEAETVDSAEAMAEIAALEVSDAPDEATRDGEAVAAAMEGDETVVDEPSGHDAVAMVDAPAEQGDETDALLADDTDAAWDDATAAVEDAMAPPAAFAALPLQTVINEADGLETDPADRLEDAVADVEASAEDLASDQSVEIDTTVEQGLATPDVADAIDAAAEAAVEVTPADIKAEAVAAAPAYQGRLEPHRFVWQMDAARRFTLVSRELSDAVGVHGTGMVGRTWADVAGALGLDPDGRVEAALARRDTWSGLTVLWPVEGAPVRVPVDLAALPSFGRNRTFDGYRGFGVCRTTEWQADPNAPIAEPVALEAPEVDAANGAADPAMMVAAPALALALAADHLVDATPAVVQDAVEVLPNLELTADIVDEANGLIATPDDNVVPDELVSTVTDAADARAEAAALAEDVTTVADTVPEGVDETAIEPLPLTEPVEPSADLVLAETTINPVDAADAPMAAGAADEPVADAPIALSQIELPAIEPTETVVEPANDAEMPAALAAIELPAVDKPAEDAAVDTTAPIAEGPPEERAEDALAERLTASVHDAAHSALDDALAPEVPMPVGSDAPTVDWVDPDAVAHAEGTALPPEVTAPMAGLIGAVAAPVAVPMDGAGLGDAVAELSDYLDAPPASAALAAVAPTALTAPIADADRVGLPTWHDTPVSEAAQADEPAPDVAEKLTGEADPAPTFELTIDDALATAPTLDPSDVVGAPVAETASHLMDAASELPTEAARILDDVETAAIAGGEAVAETAQALVAPVVERAEAVADTVTAAVADTTDPASLTQLTSSADEALAKAVSVAGRIESEATEVAALAADTDAPLDGSVAVDEGMAPDERFGLVAAVNEPTVPALPQSEARSDRASLSEIAAALNAEMRAREAEAVQRAEIPAPEDVPTAVGSLSPIGEPPVSFVPPSRPDNVIAAPIGPGAKVVTLPAGPRVHERVGERAPLSPPERDAFRQIAKVLGARMEEDGPAPSTIRPAEPAPLAPAETDGLLARDTSAREATDAASTVSAGQDEQSPSVVSLVSDNVGAVALGPETSDVLVGSLSEPADLINGTDETERFEHSPMAVETADLDPSPADADVVVSVPQTLGTAIDADEAAFVADADLEARGEPVVVDVGPLADATLETTDAAFADAALLDEGSDAVAPFVAADDLVGEAAHLDPVPLAAVPAVPSAASPSQQPVLEEFPMAVAVVQGQEIPFANQAFLDLLGYATLDDLNAAGGMDALFAGPHALKGWSGDAAIRPLPAITRDGVVVPVCVRIAKTRWADAPALVMAMETAERAVAALAAPVDADLEAGRATPLMADPTDAELGGAFDDGDEPDPRVRVAELEAVLDTATDGVVILDAEGSVVSVNRAGQALFGADAASLSGRRLVDLLAPESRRAAQDYLDGLARNGVQSLLNDGREVIAVEAGGGLVPLFMTVGRLGEGRSRAFCAVMRDITQWKKAEEELTAAKKHAELASLHKSDFLAKISHEIRTPLNAIMGFAEVMIDERFGPIGTERYKEYLKDIRTSGAHIMSLVNDLLDLSKIEAGKLDLKFEAVDLNGILRECVALMQPQANRERIIIRASLPTQVPPIVADGRSIRQIMLNLLSNAVKFTPAGGQVIVSTALEDQGQVALRVRDTGVGMTEAEVLQALEPFRQVHTAKNGAAGTGLGLPLTKALVEANRAAFAIRSTPGQGTLVEIVFPSTRVLAS